VRLTSTRIALALVALLVAGFLLPYLLMSIGGGSRVITTVPAGNVTT
jgi:hypothetical protein